ncbi:MAG TPA: TetR family transcriptional regulator [Polyangiaceae bacterium]|jgi:AcrR family transcriptional regulator|nr:TetR family transcriptional regulator [Polyangiaceae bacterium]
MKRRKKTSISARKTPVQDRSTRLVADILEAAVRVLSKEGARRFTTVRVAEEAGVSVGSLYQYFPSKEALLFRLQTDEWEETWSVVGEILADARLSPVERLEKAVLVFFRSEQQEASLRAALDDAGALFRDAPEAHAFVEVTRREVRTFFVELLPDVPDARRSLAADVVLTAMAATAEKVTAQRPDRPTVDAWAKECAAMYVAYVESVALTARRETVTGTRRSPAPRGRRPR